MLKPLTVLLVSYHFAPSNEIGGRRPTALAQFLARRGLRVLVVSAFGADESQTDDSSNPAIIPVRVRRPRKWLIETLVRYKNRSLTQSRPRVTTDAPQESSDAGVTGLLASLRRLFFRFVYVIDEHKRWAWRASNAAVRVGKMHGADLVLSSAPPTSALLAGALSAYRLGIPHVVDLRDPWIEGIGDHPVSLRIQKYLERRVVAQAAAVTSTSSAVATLMVNRNPALRSRMHVVRNGYDSEPNVGGRETGHRLSILFAGELYVGRDPFPFLSALEVLLARAEIDSDRISVRFMGRASRYDGQSLANWMRGKRCAQVVEVTGQVPHAEVMKAVSASTLLLNLSQGQRLSIPAKTYEHLVSGREILLLCENDCETAHLVANIGGVVQVDPNDTARLHSALADLYQRHVVEGILNAPTSKDVAQFSRESANESMLRVICDVLHKTRSKVQ